MANEEQERAFRSYMGTAGTSAGQQTAQYPGTYANAGNPYLYQQFPGVAGLPAAPTPPPAASSSIASYPSYTGGLQGGLQGGFPHGLQQGGYQQHGFPQRPPPLGEGEGFPREHQAQQPQQPQQHTGRAGHSQLARGYQNQPPRAQGYNTAYQYSDPRAMVPSSRNVSGNVVEFRSKHVSEYHHRQPAEAEAPPPSDTVPVLLCHTCSLCGQMRSAGYHRNHPVVPGKPLVLTPCRKCKKRVKNQHRSMSSFSRVRSCTAEVPCDWPSEDVRIDIDRYERRGRQRSRDTVFVRRSSGRPQMVRRSSSRTRLGLRAFQRDVQATRIRVSSLSPRRAARYEDIYPRPGVVMSATSQEMRPPPPTDATQRASDEVWPPPDGVHAHLFRKAEMDRPRRSSSRIVELTPSPPRERTRSTRVVYRDESVERRHRSVSPARTSRFEGRRATETVERILSHPRPYRAVYPEERNYRQTSDETSTNIDDLYQDRRGRRVSPGGGILRSPLHDREASRRRASIRESQQSTTVEIGGPRVHFSSVRRAEDPAPYSSDRLRYVEDAPARDEDFELNIPRRRYAEPPVEDMQRLRIRRPSSPSSRAQYEDDIRIDRARGISPSPSRHSEEIRFRHVSPRAQDRITAPAFRHVSREDVVGRTQSVTPPRARTLVDDDTTDSDSALEGDVAVRTWKGIDENGRKATFVEERRVVGMGMLEMGSERGGRGERVRVGMGEWRDV